jgi:hypothetical protein
MEVINLYYQTYFNYLDNQYYNIIVANKKSNGPLKEHMMGLSINNVSKKMGNLQDNYCLIVISSNILKKMKKSKLDYCTIEDIEDIYEFLLNNNYNVDKDFNKLMKNEYININNNKKFVMSINYKL